MLKLFEFDHPFFRPLWRRIAVVAICLAWGVFEITMASPGWGGLFLAIGAISFYGFFIAYPRGGTEGGDEP